MSDGRRTNMRQLSEEMGTAKPVTGTAKPVTGTAKPVSGTANTDIGQGKKKDGTNSDEDETRQGKMRLMRQRRECAKISVTLNTL